MIQIERLPASEYAVTKDPGYVDVNGLFNLYDKMAFRANVILVGPKGIGKSISVNAWAFKNKHPVVTADCSEDLRRSHLIGMNVLRGNETPFVLGPISTAFEIANETGSCILDLEEINALTPQMQKLLNAITDWRRKMEVPEAGKVFRLEKDAKLWVVGTMNTAVYGGVYSLNEDLKSRFRMIALDYPAQGAERKILALTCPEAPKDLVDQALLLAHETRQRSLEYALSTRDVVQIIEDVQLLGAEHALRIALGKFEGEDYDTVVARITSIFGIQLEKVSVEKKSKTKEL